VRYRTTVGGSFPTGGEPEQVSLDRTFYDDTPEASHQRVVEAASHGWLLSLEVAVPDHMPVQHNPQIIWANEYRPPPPGSPYEVTDAEIAAAAEADREHRRHGDRSAGQAPDSSEWLAQTRRSEGRRHVVGAIVVLAILLVVMLSMARESREMHEACLQMQMAEFGLSLGEAQEVCEVRHDDVDRGIPLGQ